MKRLSSAIQTFFLTLIFPIIVLSGCSSTRPHIQGLKSDDFNTQREAAYQLQALGKKARRALPELMNIAAHHENAELRRLAVEAIGGIGKRAWKANLVLTKALRDDDMHVRRAAVIAISKLGNYPSSAFPNLILCLGDSDPMVRQFTMNSFEELGSNGIGTLVRALSHEQVEVRRSAAITIGRLGPEGWLATGALKKACNDTDREVCKLASDALERVSVNNSRVR